MTDNPLTPAFDAITARMAADKARIAELEAENERLKRNWQTEADARVEDITRAEQAEAERDDYKDRFESSIEDYEVVGEDDPTYDELRAELAALKVCGSCDHLYCDCGQHECHESDGNPFPVSLGSSCFLPTSQWTARAEEGGE